MSQNHSVCGVYSFFSSLPCRILSNFPLKCRYSDKFTISLNLYFISTHKPDKQKNSAALTEAPKQYPFHRHLSFNFLINKSANILHALYPPFLIVFLVILLKISFSGALGHGCRREGLRGESSSRYDVAILRNIRKNPFKVGQDVNGGDLRYCVYC